MQDFERQRIWHLLFLAHCTHRIAMQCALLSSGIFGSMSISVQSVFSALLRDGFIPFLNGYDIIMKTARFHKYSAILQFLHYVSSKEYYLISTPCSLRSDYRDHKFGLI